MAEAPRPRGLPLHVVLRVIPRTLCYALRALLEWLFAERLRVAIAVGDRFEVAAAIHVSVLTHHRAPFTGGFECTLPEGVRLKAFTEAPLHSLGCGFVPDDAEEFARRLAPPEYGSPPDWDAVSVPLSARQIRRHLRAL